MVRPNGGPSPASIDDEAIVASEPDNAMNSRAGQKGSFVEPMPRRPSSGSIVGQRLASDDAEVPDGCPAARRGFRHALSDKGANFMAATVRQGPTHFPQNDFHIRFGAISELDHVCNPQTTAKTYRAQHRRGNLKLENW
jgi:hypothetical protein